MCINFEVTVQNRLTPSSITHELGRVFEQLQAERRLPQVLRTDNGPEFLGEPFTSWAKQAGMVIQYIQPGKPNQNAYIERFNRTARYEWLYLHEFNSVAHAQLLATQWLWQ